MNVGFVGLGKLGLPCALAIESRGHNVVGYDPSEQVKDIIDTKKLQYQEIWAQDYLDKTNIQVKSIEDVVKHSEIIFVPIQTPHGDKFEGITRIPDEREDFDYTYLKQGIKDLSEQMKRLFVSNGIPDKFVVHNFWYNVYHDYQGQEPHTHLTGCMEQTPYWCGIYYNKGATPTTFFRPDSNNRVHQFPYKSENFREYFADSLQPNLHDGDVILFPPYLMHCVDLQTSANMRLTFSFNLLLHNEQRVPLG